MTKRIVTLDKKMNESIGPFKKHAGNKIAVIIITRFSSKCQIVSTSSKVYVLLMFYFLVGDDAEHYDY